jgi:hypothetical protein
MGSHCQTTLAPEACTFSTIGGRVSRTLPLPIRLIRVSRPGMFCGFSFSHSSIAVSGDVPGPILTPIGLAIRLMKSMCAWSSWRVRSPIHRKWPLNPYARPSETRVSARSYSRARASCEQYRLTVRSASLSVMPQARMKSRARSISRAIAS